MKARTTLLAALILLVGTPLAAQAEKYAIDSKGAHAYVQFKISHLGYSWLMGRFNRFDGSFVYDEADPARSAIEVTVETASIDSNHAERDKHLRSEDFLHVAEHPQARFVSTAYTPLSGNEARVEGEFTLRGVTRPVSLTVTQVGAGEDPWGGFRRGFAGSMKIRLKDYGIDYNLGPAAEELELMVGFEGIRQ